MPGSDSLWASAGEGVAGQVGRDHGEVLG